VAGIPAFHVHPEHPFDGFELVERRARGPILVARCSCDVVLDVAEARFSLCPDCAGAAGRACPRCAGTGRVIDHAALEWRLPA
jgi:hypothetical protein